MPDTSGISPREKRLYLITITTLVAIGVALTSLWVFYLRVLDTEKANLAELVRSQAVLMQSLVRIEHEHKQFDTRNEGVEALLPQILEALSRQPGFGESGELVVGRRNGGEIAFLLNSRFTQQRPSSVPFEGDEAEPMRRALMGQQGTIEAVDYRGVEVLAAYRPIAELGIGLVAKKDIREVRAPFLNSASLAMAVALLITTLGGLLVYQAKGEEKNNLQSSHVSFAPEEVTKRTSVALWLFVAGLGGAILALDLALPLGVAGGVPYVALVLAGWWFSTRKHIVLLGVAASLLTIAGYLYSPAGEATWIVLVNRGYALFAIWATVIIVGIGKVSEIARIRQAQELAGEVQRHGMIQTLALDGIITITEDATVRSFNPAAERIFGYAADDVIGNNVNMLMPDPYRSHHDGYLQSFLGGGKKKIIGKIREVSGRRKDGSTFPMELSISEPIPGDRILFTGMCRDITERKRAEDALLEARTQLERRVEERTAKLRESERRFKDFAEAASDWFWETGSDLRISKVSDRFFEVTHIRPASIIGKTLAELILSEDGSSKGNGPSFDLNDRKPFRDLAFSLRGVDGNVLHLSMSGMPAVDDEGGFLGYRGTGTDITQIIKAEGRAASAQQRLTEAIGSISDGFALFDNQDRLVLFNEKYRETNFEIADIVEKDVPFEVIIRKLMERGAVGDAAGHEEEWIDERLRTHRNPERPFEFQRVDGKWIQVTEYKTRDGGTLVFVADISERKNTETELQQSQKMQALGQLTGGVAHDFNNLLTVILGNVELMERNVEGDERLTKRLHATQRAALRGSELTRQLLAFGRRQVLETKVTDVNVILSNIEDMLKRTIGEAIEVAIRPAEGLWHARVDPGKLENVILNLCINARDAMPEGGTMTIETENIHMEKYHADAAYKMNKGPYIKLVVTDTGTGMPRKVMDHVFEPFFTTKAAGKGTGLGLSMVYGFMKQSDGYIDIRSEEGHGTAITLFFPAIEEQPEELKDEAASIVRGIDLRGDETILIVEDEPDVREISVNLLESLGYRILVAENGDEALAILERHSGIDLLFSDVVMPGGINGVELGRRALDRFPGIKVLLTSGYTKNAMGQGTDKEARLNFIAKPFDISALAQKVRNILNLENGSPP